MKRSKTELLEMVETHNLMLSINRLCKEQGYWSIKCRRALYHAIGMSNFGSNDTKRKIREALELP